MHTIDSAHMGMVAQHTFAIFSAVSRKSPHFVVFEFARNSSINLIPML